MTCIKSKPWAISVILFSDKPSKPMIKGDLNIMMDSYLELHCLSQSHSAPEYYNKLLSLHYIWFLNNTQLTNENKGSLRRRVSRDDKYNQYSCTAKDTLESDRSEPVRINILCKLQSFIQSRIQYLILLIMLCCIRSILF